MALSDLDVKGGYTGNGATVNFAIPFTYWDEDEVVVIERDLDGVETILTEGALQDYTLTGATPPTTPLSTTVTMNAAPAAGVKIYVVRVLSLIQAHTFAGNSISPATLTKALDKIVGRVQQVDEAVDRAPKLDITSTATAPAMDDPEADCVLVYSSDGTRIENGPTVLEIAADVDAAEAAADAAAAAEAAAAASEAAALDSQTAAAASAASAAASAAAVAAAIPDITGDGATPTIIVAGTGIAFTGTNWFNTWYIQGSGGAVDISANPQIAAGTNVGQRLRLIGCSDANTVTLEDGTGLGLNGTCILGDKQSIDLEWNGTIWVETSRSH